MPARKIGATPLAKSGKKGKTSGGQAARQRQQQEAAARRRGISPASGSRQIRQPGAGAGHEPETVTPGPQAAPAAERWYLDVSALRIQEWLARTPGLKFRRGGSILLSDVTEERAWHGHLPAGTEWNPEAGNVDGVVPLLLTGGPGIPDGSASEESPAAAARTAAVEVVRRMREQMPFLHIQAVLGSGQSYAQAYEEMRRTRGEGAVLLDSPPAPPGADPRQAL